jgi:hypothetical protein
MAAQGISFSSLNPISITSVFQPIADSKIGWLAFGRKIGSFLLAAKRWNCSNPSV